MDCEMNYSNEYRSSRNHSSEDGDLLDLFERPSPQRERHESVMSESEFTLVTDNLSSMFRKPTEKEATIRNKASTQVHVFQRTSPTLKESSRGICSAITSKVYKVRSLIIGEDMRLVEILGPPSEIGITVLGGFLAVLYNTVFCLTMASSIIRPHEVSSGSILVPMAKVSSLGVIISSPLFIKFLSDDVSPLYPSIDLFLAPFVSHMATVIDEILYEDNVENMNESFFVTFGILLSFSMFLTGSLCLLSAKWKLANLGAFLPYPTIAGFFASVGVLLWSLAFSIDNNGVGIAHIFGTGDFYQIISAFANHFPSLCIGLGMFLLDSKGPFISPLFVIVTCAIFYCIMIAFHVPFQQAQDSHWFWSKDDLKYDINFSDTWTFPPYIPFGCLLSIMSQNVCWKAIISGLPVAFAMAFIYTLRNFLHAIALSKVNTSRSSPQTKNHQRKASISVGDIFEDAMLSKDFFRQTSDGYESNSSCNHFVKTVEKAEVYGSIPKKASTVQERIKRADPLNMLNSYGVTHTVVALLGGFACLPSISVSITLSKIGANGKAPQYLNIFFLFILYCTNFKLINFVPKAAFSSLIVKAALDTLDAWLIKSYFKIKDKAEWIVVPFIICLSFVFGMLEAFAIGVGISTFIFVGAFYQSGVVKFVANGLSIRSTVERDAKSSDWLDQHADLIQVMVLQNYLFFGNASSCLPYIESMFEEFPDDDHYHDLPPKPAVVVIDINLVTGMDTSAIDVFHDIAVLCKLNSCRVFVSGASQNVRRELISRGFESSKTFFTALEPALGAAEDFILKEICCYEQREKTRVDRRMKLLSEDLVSLGNGDNGFLHALQQIDEQHALDTSVELKPLAKYTSPVVIEAGQLLFDSIDSEGVISENDRGIFFIEHGILKVEKDPSQSLTRNSRSFGTLHSIGSMKARSPSKAQLHHHIKKKKSRPRHTHTFRLARIGPGWVVGSIEAFTGLKNPGVHIAVTDCRLHHLPYEALLQIEGDDPVLALKLLKLLAHLLARRQDITIEQMSTHHSIMTNQPLKKPVKRSTMAAIGMASFG